EKRVFLVILFTSFSGSLVSRIPGAVHGGEPYDPGCWRGKVQDWDGAGLVVEDESEFLTGQ
ncbi:hypothetical protein R9J46_00360, partial [Escherichia coli]